MKSRTNTTATEPIVWCECGTVGVGPQGICYSCADKKKRTKGTLMESKAKSVIEVIQAIVGAIKESGPQGVPSGHLYATLMGQGCTLQQWEGLERLLLASGVVTKQGQLLIYGGK